MKIIVAVDKNWGIGCNGKLLTYIPEDLKFFKEMTLSKTVVMGRKTYESLPKANRPLPERQNIIITTKKDFSVENAIVLHSIEETLNSIKIINTNDIFIIGGETIYKQFLPFVDECLVTKINKSFSVDTYHPNLDKMKEWYIAKESKEQTYNKITYKWVTYKKNYEKI